MKWRSKATGAEYEVFDSFKPTLDGYYVGLQMPNLDKPTGFIPYSRLIEAFEKVEE